MFFFKISTTKSNSIVSSVMVLKNQIFVFCCIWFSTVECPVVVSGFLGLINQTKVNTAYSSASIDQNNISALFQNLWFCVVYLAIEYVFVKKTNVCSKRYVGIAVTINVVR